MTQESIRRIREAQLPVRRKYTKRQVEPFSQTNILSTRDANRSITVRKAEEKAKQGRKLAKQFEKVDGYAPPQRSEGSFQRAMQAEREGREAGDNFLLINS